MAAALEHVASAATIRGDNDALLARALYARFAAERAIERVAMSAAAALGGMSFIESPEIAYLLGASRALAFHPPSRAAAAGPIARYLADGPLTLLCGYRLRYAESSTRRPGRATFLEMAYEIATSRPFSIYRVMGMGEQRRDRVYVQLALAGPGHDRPGQPASALRRRWAARRGLAGAEEPPDHRARVRPCRRR